MPDSDPHAYVKPGSPEDVLHDWLLGCQMRRELPRPRDAVASLAAAGYHIPGPDDKCVLCDPGCEGCDPGHLALVCEAHRRRGPDDVDALAERIEAEWLYGPDAGVPLTRQEAETLSRIAAREAIRYASGGES